ncbi:MAG: flagellar assembly protein FliW [Bryobacterales bacterium]|nr:flagellar assembly protein FliW [Bryobacterales bacterium]
MSQRVVCVPTGPMAVLETKLFGSLEYQPDQLITLAAPMPGLPGIRKLLPVSQRVIAPFVFFQSLEEPAVCLLAAPAKVAQEGFRLELNPEDKALLGLPEPSLPDESSELGVFTFVSVTDSEMATANLLAPLVIHLTRNLAVQAIQPFDESLLRFPLDIAVAEAEPC